MGSNKDKIKKLLKSKFFYLGLLVLLFGGVLNQISSIYIFYNFPNAPQIKDTLLEFIPTFNLSWVFDLFSILTMISFLFYAYTKRFESIPYFLLLFGLLQILRGFFIILTPFANPDIGTYNGFLNTSEFFRRGLFPSGHTGTSFLAFLFVEGVYKKIFLIFSLLVIVFLILSHGHYSIDIFAAILFAYAVYCFGEKNFKEAFTLH